jgi:hypothetical protein
MYQISRRDKRRRTGFEYAPDVEAPSLLNKSQYVMMNGKISSRSQYMGLNFKDDSRDTTYVNIAEAGYAFDAVSRSDVVSTAPVNVAAAGRAVINMRQLLTFLSMLFEVDPTLKDLLERYKARFKQQYVVLEPMATVDANPKVTPKTGSMVDANTETGSMATVAPEALPVGETAGKLLGNKYFEILTIIQAYLTSLQFQLASGAITTKVAAQEEADLNKVIDAVKLYIDSEKSDADKLKHLDYIKNELIKNIEGRIAGGPPAVTPKPVPSPSAVTSDTATTVSAVIGPAVGQQKTPKPALGADGQYDFVTLAKEGRLDALTVKELKVYLRVKKLSRSGNKAVLVARIQDHLISNPASSPTKMLQAVRKSLRPLSLEKES